MMFANTWKSQPLSVSSHQNKPELVADGPFARVLLLQRCTGFLEELMRARNARSQHGGFPHAVQHHRAWAWATALQFWDDLRESLGLIWLILSVPLVAQGTMVYNGAHLTRKLSCARLVLFCFWRTIVGVWLVLFCFWCTTVGACSSLLFPSLGLCTYVYVFSFAAKENIQALVCSCAYPCTNQKCFWC